MRPVFLKVFAALALLSSASAASATTVLTFGDSLTLEYWFETKNAVHES